MKEIKWIDRHIDIEVPKRPKKITGTRFATILGLNPWSTPFEAWCAITRTYEKPFIDNIYVNAGKVIEPKQAEYMRKSYGMGIVTPTDIFGENFFQKTRGDFFPENKICGGMYDFLAKDENGNVDTVLEMKTTKRIEDWKNDVPEYYALQAALYAYLLGVDNVIMVASFLEEKDYDNPSKYVPSVKNTITVEFKVSERYPNFKDMVDKVEAWWKEHVATGISPEFDEKKDADILKELRTNTLSPETDIEELIKEGEKLKVEIDDVTKGISEKEKRLKKINDIVKKHAMSQFREGDNKVEIKGSKYVWAITRSESTKTVYDDEALKADGLYDKYTTVTTNESYRMTVK